MPLTLDLSPEVEAALTEEAIRLGVTPERLAADAVRRALPSRLDGVSDEQIAADATAVRTGADLVAYWRKYGLIGCRRDIADPIAYARQLREQSQRPRYERP